MGGQAVAAALRIYCILRDLFWAVEWETACVREYDTSRVGKYNIVEMPWRNGIMFTIWLDCGKSVGKYMYLELHVLPNYL